MSIVVKGDDLNAFVANDLSKADHVKLLANDRTGEGMSAATWEEVDESTRLACT